MNEYTKELPNKRGRRRKWDSNTLNMFKQYIEDEDNRFKTLRQIKKGFEDRLRDNFNIQINFSKNSYYLALTNKDYLNYSYKKSRKITFTTRMMMIQKFKGKIMQNFSYI